MTTPAGAPAIPPATVDAVVCAGIARGRALFNRADFWGSHEALEVAWHAAPTGQREIIQGLIQAAAAFHKLVVQDNPHGAARLLDWALERLDGVADGQFGLDMPALRGELRGWVARLATPRDGDTGGPILGLPQLVWSATGAAARLQVDAVSLYALEHEGSRAILVAVEAAGLTGWGECRLAWDLYGTWSALADGLVPALLAEPVAAPAELGVRWSDVAAHPSARAGLEAAVWDVWSRRAGVPLAEALGIALRPVPLAARVHAAEPDLMHRELAGLADAGFAQVILPARPNADRRVLPGLAAEALLPVALDLAGGYRMADLAALRVLDGLGAAWLHQPFPRWALADMERLCRYLQTPLSLGGWTIEEEVRDALALPASAVVAVDPGICGLTEAVRMADLAASRHRPLWVTSSATTPVGAMADLALAAHAGVTLPSDLAGARDAGGEPAIRPSAGGMATPPSTAGLGVIPDSAWLAEVTTARRSLRA